MSDHTLTQIAHYQKKLEKYAATGDDEKLLYCIHKLKYLPVTVNHLEITGVGKSINGLRHKNGMIGEKAKALVQKWKLMVAQEEEQQEAEEEVELSSQDHADSKSQTSHQSDHQHIENDEEYEPSDEGDRLQIEEDNVDDTYNPGGLSHAENEEEPCNGYDPKTSREDYMSFNTEVKQEYNPTSKYSPGSQDEDLSAMYTPSPSVPNGFDTVKKENTHKSKEESKHKKKKHKSRHDKESKHKSREESSDSKKSKHKSSKKDKGKESSKSSSSHSSSKSHSSSHKSDKQKMVDIKSSPPVSHNSHSNNNNNSIKVSSSGKASAESSDRKRHRESEDEIESPSSKKNKVSDEHKDKKSHKSKSSKEEHKSSKKQKALEAHSEFEAALMGMEGTSSKKKKKKPKEKDTKKNVDEAYSPNRPNQNSKKNVDEAYSPNRSNQNSKYKELNLESREELPSLPTSFEDDIEAPQLMTHYKPLPQVPQRAAHNNPFTNQMTDEEALNFMLSSRNSKQRRIYTGKATLISSVPSLFDVCIRVLQENIDALETLGGIPFDILKPVFEKASPQQLFSLEDYNPYLLDDTDVLWAAHCRKSFKNKQREDMETWRDMFIRCTDENQEKMRSVTESLQKKYITKAPPKRTTQLAFINTVAKPPKSVARAQARYGTGSSVPSRSINIKAEEQHKASSSSSSSSSSTSVPKVEKSFPNKPPTVKKPKVAPLMGKARQLMKKVCRR